MKNLVLRLSLLAVLISAGIPFRAHSIVMGGGLGIPPSGGVAPAAWAPASKTGLVFNLDAKTPTQFGSPADLALISTWTSDQGHAWGKFSDATRPYYAANAGDGYPGMMFSQAGASGGMRHVIPAPGTAYFVSPGTPFCLLIVFRPTNVVGAERVMMTFEHAAGTGPPFVELNVARVAWQSNNGTWRSWRTGTTLSVNTTNYTVINYDGGTATNIASYAAWVNGVSETLTASANGSATNFNIMGDYSGGTTGDRYQGALKQIVFWSGSTCNATDRTNITGYVPRWGL